MYKVTSVFFSIFLIGVSLAGLRASGGELGMFLTVNETQTFGRLALAFVLLLSLFTSSMFMKTLLGAGAAGLTAITIAGLSGAGFYLLPFDFFIVLEGSILCLLGNLRPATVALDWTRIKRKTTELIALRSQKVTQP